MGFGTEALCWSHGTRVPLRARVPLYLWLVGAVRGHVKECGFVVELLYPAITRDDCERIPYSFHVARSPNLESIIMKGLELSSIY